MSRKELFKSGNTGIVESGNVSPLVVGADSISVPIINIYTEMISTPIPKKRVSLTNKNLSQKQILGSGTPQADYRPVKNTHTPSLKLPTTPRLRRDKMAGTHTTLYNIRVYYYICSVF